MVIRVTRINLDLRNEREVSHNDYAKICEILTETFAERKKRNSKTGLVEPVGSADPLDREYHNLFLGAYNAQYNTVEDMKNKASLFEFEERARRVKKSVEDRADVPLSTRVSLLLDIGIDVALAQSSCDIANNPFFVPDLNALAMRYVSLSRTYTPLVNEVLAKKPNRIFNLLKSSTVNLGSHMPYMGDRLKIIDDTVEKLVQVHAKYTE
ncbi:MAG: hypothetical protein AABX19_04070 [Nanoarchaeota archaeon]